MSESPSLFRFPISCIIKPAQHALTRCHGRSHTPCAKYYRANLVKMGLSPGVWLEPRGSLRLGLPRVDEPQEITPALAKPCFSPSVHQNEGRHLAVDHACPYLLGKAELWAFHRSPSLLLHKHTRACTGSQAHSDIIPIESGNAGTESTGHPTLHVQWKQSTCTLRGGRDGTVHYCTVAMAAPPPASGRSNRPRDCVPSRHLT